MKLSEFEPGMVIKHVPGHENILADILSRQADYAPVGKIVPWLTPIENACNEADTLVLDRFEALSWGRGLHGLRNSVSAVCKQKWKWNSSKQNSV